VSPAVAVRGHQPIRVSPENQSPGKPVAYVGERRERSLTGFPTVDDVDDKHCPSRARPWGVSTLPKIHNSFRHSGPETPVWGTKMKSGLLSTLKSKLVADVRQVRIIPLGLYKGLQVDINLRSQTQLFLGLWERETYEAIRQAASRATWFIDVGAGRGELVIYFAKLKHVSKIIAIEPSYGEAQYLRNNINYNGIGLNKIEVIEKFAGTGKGDSYVTIDQLGMIPSFRGLLKIDVDGFELDVLQSAQQVLSQGNADLLIETHSAELEGNCIKFLETVDYSCRVIKNAWWRALIPEQRPTGHNRWLFAEKRMR